MARGQVDPRLRRGLTAERRRGPDRRDRRDRPAGRNAPSESESPRDTAESAAAEEDNTTGLVGAPDPGTDTAEQAAARDRAQWEEARRQQGRLARVRSIDTAVVPPGIRATAAWAWRILAILLAAYVVLIAIGPDPGRGHTAGDRAAGRRAAPAAGGGAGQARACPRRWPPRSRCCPRPGRHRAAGLPGRGAVPQRTRRPDHADQRRHRQDPGLADQRPARAVPAADQRLRRERPTISVAEPGRAHQRRARRGQHDRRDHHRRAADPVRDDLLHQGRPEDLDLGRPAVPARQPRAGRRRRRAGLAHADQLRARDAGGGLRRRGRHRRSAPRSSACRWPCRWP